MREAPEVSLVGTLTMQQRGKGICSVSMLSPVGGHQQRCWSSGCCRTLPVCWSLHTRHTSKACWPQGSTLCALLWCLSLSLSAPLRQHNKSRHVPTRHQQPDQACEHAPRPEGEDQRERKRGGKPRKKIPSVTQAASVSEHAPLLLLTLSTRGVAVRGCTGMDTARDTVKAGFLTKAQLGKSKKRTLK